MNLYGRGPRCQICGSPHAPGPCPTSGAGSGAPRSILGAAAVPPPNERGEALYAARLRVPPAWEEATREIPCNLAVGLGSTINDRIAARYDELMREGKHGHYETMFRVMAEVMAEDMAAVEPPLTVPPPEPTGPAPWMAPKGECRSCDRRRDSVKASKKKGSK